MIVLQYLQYANIFHLHPTQAVKTDIPRAKTNTTNQLFDQKSMQYC